MSLKYSSTTADYLIWSDAMNLIRKLAKVNLIEVGTPYKDIPHLIIYGIP